MFRRALIGMVHTGAFASTPRAGALGDVAQLAERAVGEARVLRDAGYDALIVENMHDLPYVNGPHDAAVVAGMALVVGAVRSAVGASMPVGVQVLSRGEREALAICHATQPGASFVRCENFVFAHVADEGLLADAAAGPLLRYRALLGATNIPILADIQKKHASHAITADLDLAELAKAAQFFRADGVIVTGLTTGQPTSASDVATVRKAVGPDFPVVVGSGVTPEQVPELFRYADALIVGSWIKQDGVWDKPVDPARARALVAARR